MSEWNVNQYSKFEKERTQPSLDLLNRLNGEYKNILDLGSGPGNSTFALKNKFPNAKILGIDSSKNMLEKAQKNYANLENLKFEFAVAPEFFYSHKSEYDLIFSNACIHWIKNQQELCETVFASLKHGGTFAFQIPFTQESQFYKNLYTLIEEKWQNLKSIKNFYNLNAAEYYDLYAKKFEKVSLWKTDYYHLVENPEGILEWYKGSGLKPYLDFFDDDNDKNAFLSDLLNLIKQNYTPQLDGKYFLIMPRFFFVGVRI